MINEIKRTVAFLIALGTKAVAAIAQYGSALTLAHTTEADLPAKMAALTAANTAHKETLVSMKTKRAALAAATKAANRFMTVVRESLKPTVGYKYSEQWTAVGFAGKLAVPRTAEALLNTLQLAQGYLTAHPIADGGPNLTAARAGALHDALSAALTAVTQQKETVNQALKVRNEAAKALEGGLHTLLSELHQVLDPMDARWLAFGFLKPGQLQAPAVPQKVIALLVGPTSASVKWDKAARAQYYRVWKKVLGKEDDYTAVGSPADLDFTLENLPAGSEIEVVVTAVNNGGESARSEVYKITTPAPVAV